MIKRSQRQFSEPHCMEQTMKRKKIETYNMGGIDRWGRDKIILPYSCEDEDIIEGTTHSRTSRRISDSGSSFFSSSFESQQDTNSESGSFWELIPRPDFMSDEKQQSFPSYSMAPLQLTSPLNTSWFNENLYDSRSSQHHQKANVSVDSFSKPLSLPSNQEKLSGQVCLATSYGPNIRNLRINEYKDNDDMFGVKESFSNRKTSGVTPKRKSRHGERMDNACFKTKTNPFFKDISGFQHSSPFEDMVFHKPQDGVLSTCAVNAKDISCGYFRLRSKATLTLESTSSITFLVLTSCLTITQNNKKSDVNSGSFAYIPSDILYTLQNNTEDEVQLSYFKCIDK